MNMHTNPSRWHRLTLDATKAALTTPQIHPDPKIRAARADDAWAIATDEHVTDAELRCACLILIANATDTRRDTARDLLKILDGEGA